MKSSDLFKEELPRGKSIPDLTMDLPHLLIEYAKQEGFPLAAVIDIDLALSTSFDQHVKHYDHWIKSGFHGSMEYLVRGRDRRANPRLLFPDAESLLCVAIPYPRKPAGSPDPNSGPRYARYLQGPDYHHQLAEKLERVLQRVKKDWEPSSHLPSLPTEKLSLRWKVCIDTSAVLERSWAALAGLGWIGKNTLLIHPRYGSYLFLGEVLINQKTGQGPRPLPSYCGNCTRCLTSCPTQALEKPHVLNSNQCISYLTLEKKSALDLEESVKKQMGVWVAGCDICQEACPFNRKPVRDEKPDVYEENATDLQSWKALLLESPSGYRLRVKDSAMKRMKPEQFSRNLAMSLGNFLSHLSALDVETYRESLGPDITTRLERETDPAALSEWQRCIFHLYKNKI